MAGGGWVRDVPLSLRRKIAGAAAALLLAPMAWGQGGGGAGGCGDRALEKLAASGSLDQFVALLDARVNRYRKHLEEALTSRLFGWVVSSPKASQLPTPEEVRRFYVNRAGCLDVLLDHAVAGGNIPVIDALLAAGADVNGRPDNGSEFVVKDGAVQQRPPNVDARTLLMRCPRVAGPRNKVVASGDPPGTDEQRALTRRGFEHILSRGADVHLLDSYGDSALKTCESADMLSVLVAHGAEPNLPTRDGSYLDIWVRRLIEADRPGTEALIKYRAEVVETLDRLLPALRSKMLSPEVERRVCRACGQGKVEACTALRQRIDVADERMLLPDSRLDASEWVLPRVERCAAYQQQDRLRPRPWDPLAQARECSVDARYLPQDVVVVAAGGSGGRKLDLQMDSTGFVATQFDVKVHADRPVALLLGAHEPTIWSLSWTEGSRIAAVYVNGHGHQVLTGIPQGTPAIVGSEQTPGSCSRRLSVSRGLRWDAGGAAVARDVFGQDVLRVVPVSGRDGVLDINLSERPAGPYESVPGVTAESLRDPRMPRVGEAGLQWAVSQGLLRLATEAERKQAREHGAGSPTPERTYVVLKPMVLPAGLKGRETPLPPGMADGFVIALPAYFFIVPPGVAAPYGRSDGVQIVDLSQPHR